MVERDFSPYGPVAVPLMLSGQITARFHQASQQAGGAGSQPGTGGVGLRPWSQTVRIYGVVQALLIGSSRCPST